MIIIIMNSLSIYFRNIIFFVVCRLLMSFSIMDLLLFTILMVFTIDTIIMIIYILTLILILIKQTNALELVLYFKLSVEVVTESIMEYAKTSKYIHYCDLDDCYSVNRRYRDNAYHLYQIQYQSIYLMITIRINY